MDDAQYVRLLLESDDVASVVDRITKDHNKTFQQRSGYASEAQSTISSARPPLGYYTNGLAGNASTGPMGLNVSGTGGGGGGSLTGSSYYDGAAAHRSTSWGSAGRGRVLMSPAAASPPANKSNAHEGSNGRYGNNGSTGGTKKSGYGVYATQPASAAATSSDGRPPFIGTNSATSTAATSQQDYCRPTAIADQHQHPGQQEGAGNEGGGVNDDGEANDNRSEPCGDDRASYDDATGYGVRFEDDVVGGSVQPGSPTDSMASPRSPGGVRQRVEHQFDALMNAGAGGQGTGAGGQQTPTTTFITPTDSNSRPLQGGSNAAAPGAGGGATNQSVNTSTASLKRQFGEMYIDPQASPLLEEKGLKSNTMNVLNVSAPFGYNMALNPAYNNHNTSNSISLSLARGEGDGVDGGLSSQQLNQLQQQQQQQQQQASARGEKGRGRADSFHKTGSARNNKGEGQQSAQPQGRAAEPGGRSESAGASARGGGSAAGGELGGVPPRVSSAKVNSSDVQSPIRITSSFVSRGDLFVPTTTTERRVVRGGVVTGQQGGETEKQPPPPQQQQQQQQQQQRPAGRHRRDSSTGGTNAVVGNSSLGSNTTAAAANNNSVISQGRPPRRMSNADENHAAGRNPTPRDAPSAGSPTQPPRGATDGAGLPPEAAKANNAGSRRDSPTNEAPPPGANATAHGPPPRPQQQQRQRQQGGGRKQGAAQQEEASKQRRMGLLANMERTMFQYPGFALGYGMGFSGVQQQHPQQPYQQQLQQQQISADGGGGSHRGGPAPAGGPPGVVPNYGLPPQSLVVAAGSRGGKGSKPVVSLTSEKERRHREQKSRAQSLVTQMQNEFFGMQQPGRTSMGPAPRSQNSTGAQGFQAGAARQPAVNDEGGVLGWYAAPQANGRVSSGSAYPAAAGRPPALGAYRAPAAPQRDYNQNVVLGSYGMQGGGNVSGGAAAGRPSVSGAAPLPPRGRPSLAAR